jgi:hypothetical protein
MRGGGRKLRRYSEFETTDEIFVNGNAVTVHAVNHIDERSLQPG